MCCKNVLQSDTSVRSNASSAQFEQKSSLRKTPRHLNIFTKKRKLQAFARYEILDFRKNVYSKGACMEIIETLKPKMYITKRCRKNGFVYMEGNFESPYGSVFPEMMLEDNKIARWCGFFPLETKRALVIHLAGTGDHTFVRRRLGFADGLLRSNVSSILLENPFYGNRKPRNQFRSNLLTVSDLFVMGGALICECNFLLKWAKENGYSPLGISGVSMGGFMASLAYTNSIGPVSLIPCLSSSTAAPVYVKGPLSQAVQWNLLDAELKDKSFRSKIQQIPDCYWIEKAHETACNFSKRESFSITKQEICKQFEDGLRLAIHLHIDVRTNWSGCSSQPEFMYVLLDEFTSVTKYPMPFDTSLVKNVIAERDAYIVKSDEPTLQDLWPGSCLEVLKGFGHITAYLANHLVFRRSILEMLSRNERLYSS